MKKIYVAKKCFWIGEINKELKLGARVEYDLETGVLVLNDKTFDVKNLKAAIKATWLTPEDGDYSDAKFIVGETADEEADRKRKERFADLARKKAAIKSCISEEEGASFVNALGIDQRAQEILVTDAREVAVVNKTEAQMAKEVLKVEPVGTTRKFKGEIIEDDTQVIVRGNLFNNKEAESLKNTLNPEVKEKKDPKDFKVFTDHYNTEAVHVGKYTDLNKEQTISNWSSLHWTKKADIIKEADKGFLNQLKSVEHSEKMIQRIDKKLQSA